MGYRWWKTLSFAGLIGIVTLAGGCAHTISKAMRQQADMTISFTQLQANPEAYKDRTVILGGKILNTHNVKEGSLLEILQKPLDRYERPSLSDRTEGRFMVRCEKYLDPAIYKQDREMTVAGRVLGARKGLIGETEYTYPLISCVELHLWPEPLPPSPYGPYPWWYWDDPFWRPYYHPFWRPYYYPGW
jgi:outer membrane lipoprotein